MNKNMNEMNKYTNNQINRNNGMKSVNLNIT